MTPLLLLLFIAQQMPHEMLWTEWAATPIEYFKAPMDAVLPVSTLPLEAVASDDLIVHEEPLPLGGMYCCKEQPSRQSLQLIQTTLGPRVLVSFSPGLNIGKGVWSWRATACNTTDQTQVVDSGDIEAAANSVGIPTIGFGEAQVSNQLAINRSKPVVGTQLAMGATGIGTALIAARIIAASGPWGAGFAVATYAASRLIDYLKTVTPADLTVRFSGTQILQDNLSAALPPRSGPHHCATWEFFARNSHRNAIARAGVPIP